jgi:hypothetical protein
MTFFLCICRDQRVGRKVQAGDGGEIDQDKQHLRGMPRSGSDCRACFRRSYLQNPWMKRLFGAVLKLPVALAHFRTTCWPVTLAKGRPTAGGPMLGAQRLSAGRPVSPSTAVFEGPRAFLP